MMMMMVWWVLNPISSDPGHQAFLLGCEDFLRRDQNSSLNEKMVYTSKSKQNKHDFSFLDARKNVVRL
jgi:hypothetical protein